MKIAIPVGATIDNDYKTWNRYQNHYWPAMYLIDKQGVIRHIRIAEAVMIRPSRKFVIC
jgi:hypothetical protein